MDKCDAEVFRNGLSLAALDASSSSAERWVRTVAAQSGQRVDWHYSGGVAHVLVLGDHGKAMAAAKNITASADDAGCYRTGVTPIPDGVIGVDVAGSL